jgi:hypothetical protein
LVAAKPRYVYAARLALLELVGTALFAAYALVILVQQGASSPQL